MREDAVLCTEALAPLTLLRGSIQASALNSCVTLGLPFLANKMGK